MAHKVLHKAPHKARYKNHKCIIHVMYHQNRIMKQITMKKKVKMPLLVNLKNVTTQPNHIRIVVVIAGAALVNHLKLESRKEN